jgi:cellulose synthase/poly-beta-1,6-N-acetylglucosamine synthase-like glycosyltransferase
MLLQNAFIAFSLILTFILFLYGFNHYYLLYQAYHYQPPILDAARDARPNVSIHLAMYNEKYVVRRLVTACIEMAAVYGMDKVNILLLDDSDDDTKQEVDAVATEYKQRGFRVETIRRADRQGYKAGALQAALEHTPEDFIVLFDADFIPPADFLVRTVPYLIQDKNLGVVQSRWAHLNRNYNLLTRAIAIAVDIHFLIEQTGRYAAGLFQNFNGSAGVIRKQAILEAGGWQADTLAEDLDLSYRMQLHGYRILYLKDIQSPAEIPPTIPSFKKQQGRWACGSMRTARKILPVLLPNHKYQLKQRLQAFIHLTGYMIFPLITISFVLNCIATFMNIQTNVGTHADTLYLSHGWLVTTGAAASLSIRNISWALLGLLATLCTISPWVTSITTLRAQKIPVWQNLASLLILLLLGFGLSINNTLEVFRGLFSNRRWEFTRTPKYAEMDGHTNWKSKRYQIALDPVWILELAFAILGILAIISAVQHVNYSVLSVLIPFTFAYIFTSVLTVLQSQR